MSLFMLLCQVGFVIVASWQNEPWWLVADVISGFEELMYSGCTELSWASSVSDQVSPQNQGFGEKAMGLRLVSCHHSGLEIYSTHDWNIPKLIQGLKIDPHGVHKRVDVTAVTKVRMLPKPHMMWGHVLLLRGRSCLVRYIHHDWMPTGFLDTAKGTIAIRISCSTLMILKVTYILVCWVKSGRWPGCKSARQIWWIGSNGNADVQRSLVLVFEIINLVL
jgi:hypothetical protein